MVRLIFPKRYVEKNEFNIALQTTGVARNTYVLAEFMSNEKHEQILKNEDKLSPMTMQTKHGNLNQPLSVTFFRDNKCSKREINIKKYLRTVYLFLQLDKPTYKPGDDIQYRVVMLNHLLKPFYPTAFKIILTSPDGVKVAVRDEGDYDKSHLKGVLEDIFKLDIMANVGNWIIEVTLNNNSHLTTSKKFMVQKYILPLFEVKLLAHPHFTIFENINVTVEARYSFDEFVKGSARVEIFDILNADSSSGEFSERLLYFTTKEITTSDKFDFIIKDDLKIKKLRADPHMLRINVEFTDTLGKTGNATKFIWIYQNTKCKISLVNVQPYKKNGPFKFDVLVEKIRGGLMNDTQTYLTVKVNDGTPIVNRLNKGLASFKYNCLTLEKFKLDINFEKKCSNTFEISQNGTVQFEELLVYYTPEK